MSDVMVFKNPSFGSLRVVKINDEPWFVAKDVCDCLGLSDVSIALNYLDDDDKRINIIDAQEMTTISDFGFYALIQRSCSPNARAIKLWVTQVVVPSVRKTEVISFDDPIEAARAETEKAQAALRAEQAAHLATKRKLEDMLKALSMEDKQSVCDMQPSLNKYFDTNKTQGGVSFLWYMTTFMRAYCNGGIHDYFSLPEELQGRSFRVTRRDGLSVFPMSAWADIIIYFGHHKDSLKNLPCIGYAARS